MISKEYFFKKFNVGLTLEDNENAYGNFISRYGEFIQTIYFSPPFGSRFHSRKIISAQLDHEELVKRLWTLLQICKDNNINIELALNVPEIPEEEIVKVTKSVLDNIQVDSIVCLKNYRQYLCNAGINTEYIYSYNNPNNSYEDYKENGYGFSKYVVARNNLRNYQLHRKIRETMGENILLLNNGCNPYCKGNCYYNDCPSLFYYTITKIDVERLYAIASIMPFEIHEGLINLENVDYFKISNRINNLNYTQRCLDSYINNINEVSAKNKNIDYLLWGRLTGFGKYYSSFNMDNIISIKRELYDTNYFGEFYSNSLQTNCFDMWGKSSSI